MKQVFCPNEKRAAQRPPSRKTKRGKTDQGEGAGVGEDSGAGTVMVGIG